MGQRSEQILVKEIQVTNCLQKDAPHHMSLEMYMLKQ